VSTFGRAPAAFVRYLRRYDGQVAIGTTRQRHDLTLSWTPELARAAVAWWCLVRDESISGMI
jgi:hypothetical protein